MFVEPVGLVGGHLLADIEEHVCIGFFQIAPCNDYLINLDIDLSFVEHTSP